jgi:hypothetical protein
VDLSARELMLLKALCDRSFALAEGASVALELLRREIGWDRASFDHALECLERRGCVVVFGTSNAIAPEMAHILSAGRRAIEHAARLAQIPSAHSAGVPSVAEPFIPGDAAVRPSVPPLDGQASDAQTPARRHTAPAQRPPERPSSSR